MMRVAIIGCGLVGRKRANALQNIGMHPAICVDVNRDRAQSIATAFAPNARVLTDWRTALQDDQLDLVILSTTHNLLTEIAIAAVRAGKHVLLEKPAARSAAELEGLIRVVDGGEVLVRVGFNHRYHPALQQAKQLFDSGELGDLMYIRGRYGHGGRIGYEKEWRANPDISGAGELIDQGIHLIDLARWFLKDFTEVTGFSHTYFWNMPVEDNGFMILRTASQQVAFLHASWTEWKNLFSFEIFGRLGKLEISGLGRSYGQETLTHFRMLPEMGPPEIRKWEYPDEDLSWEKELQEFIEDITLNRRPSASLQDAYEALKIIEKIKTLK
jgi:predicted dehydrogenase